MKLNESSKSRYNIEALSRGLEILTLFSALCPTLSLMQIVEKLKINKSTAYRVLSTLESSQYLELDPSTRLYRPGLKVLQLGFTAINGIELRQLARPHLERLSRMVGETVSLAVLNDFQTIYIDRIRNQMIVGVILEVGSSIPAHCTSLGKVLLADLPDEEINILLGKNLLTGFTIKTVVTADELRSELILARKMGYALDDEELADGLRAVSAPIRDNNRRAIAAVNVTGTTNRISFERLYSEIIPALLDVTSQISTALGYFPEAGSQP